MRHQPPRIAAIATAKPVPDKAAQTPLLPFRRLQIGAVPGPPIGLWFRPREQPEKQEGEEEEEGDHRRTRGPRMSAP